MKVLVKFTVDVSDEERKALAWKQGARDDSLARHSEVLKFYALHGLERGPAILQDAIKDYYKAKAAFYAEKAATGTTGAEKAMD